MATRLTSTHKQQIVFAVLNHAFGYREGTIRTRETQLAHEVYAKLYTPEQLKQMNDLGSEFFQHRTDINIRMPKKDGYNVWLELRLGGSKPFGHQTLQRNLDYADFGTGLQDSLGQRIVDFYHVTETIGKEKEDRRRELNNALDGFGTLRQLREAWPELVPVLDKLGLENKTRQLPVVVNRSTLNAALGLPPK
jgi:hypothetical protein